MRSLGRWGIGAAIYLCGCGMSASDPGQKKAGLAGAAGSANAESGAGGTAAAQGGSSTGGAANITQAGSDSVSMSGGGSSAAGNGGGGAASCNGSTPMVAPAPTACPATAGTTPPDTALAAVNDLRAHMGLTCMALVPEINTSAQKHCDYYQQNMADKVCTANAHVEVATCPGFVAENFNTRMTDAGYKGSPRSEVMAFSGDPSSALGQWINSVYHRTPLLSPWILEMGYGMTADCDTIDMGQGAKPADDVTAVYPYPGQVDLPLSFDGSHEGPMPPAPPTGWPSATPAHLYIKNFTVTAHDMFVNNTCEPLAHQWLPDKEQDILYADKPLAPHTEYRVIISGTRTGKPLTFDWTFTSKN